MILPWLAASLSHAECPQPVAASALNGAVVQAFTAYSNTPNLFVTTADQAFSMVDCLGEPAAPSLAASLHWIRGMKMLAGGDALASQRAITAALRIDPSSTHPAGGELGEVVSRAQLALHPAPTTPMHLPGYSVEVDGKKVSERPVDGPYLLQVVDAGGGVAFTQYVADGEEPHIPHDVRALAAASSSMGVPDVLADADPDWTAAVNQPADLSAPPRLTPPPKSHSSAGQRSPALLFSALITGGFAGGAFGASIYERTQYNKVKTLSGYHLTNGTYFGSIGGAVVSAGLLTTYLIVR